MIQPLWKIVLTVSLKTKRVDFPGGTMVKNLPAKAGYMGLNPGPGRSHVPWSN